jgi:zinc resistance-associated protein
MRKAFRYVLVALALLPAPIAFAANAESFVRPQRFSAQDLAAFAEARIAGLKTGLQLKPEQEKLWSTLESVLRDTAKARVARIEDWRDHAPETFDADPVGALQRRAQGMTVRAGELEKIAAAAKPLYDNLDEAQKRRFGALIRAAIAERPQHGRGPHGGPHGGPGGPGQD